MWALATSKADIEGGEERARTECKIGRDECRRQRRGNGGFFQGLISRQARGTAGSPRDALQPLLSVRLIHTDLSYPGAGVCVCVWD